MNVSHNVKAFFEGKCLKKKKKRGISKCHLMIVIPTMLIVTGLGIRNMIYAGVLQNPNWSYFEEFICDYGY